MGVAATIAAGSGGCGDPLVGPDYAGEPLLDISGELIVENVGELQGAEGQLRLAIFWASIPERTFVGNEGITDFADQSVVISDFPTFYTARLYAPPDNEVLIDVEGLRLSMGSLVIYLDADRDGRYDPGDDTPIGAGRSHLIVWLEEASETPLGFFPRGYHRVKVPRSMGEPICGDDLPIANVVVADDEVEVVVNLIEETLVDLDCDGRQAEYNLCPPPPGVIESCPNPDRQSARCTPWSHCPRPEASAWTDPGEDTGAAGR